MRDLKANEIEVRVHQVKGNGVSLLLYKTARCDMDMLDEEFGPKNWKREHVVKDGRLYCIISAWDAEKSQWVSKEDVGTESETDAEKGQASDSFKRAGTNWGIGRELYTAPFIWISNRDCTIKETGRKDKFGNPIMRCIDNFEIEKISIQNKEIVGIAIKNESTGKRVFVWTKNGGTKNNG